MTPHKFLLISSLLGSSSTLLLASLVVYWRKSVCVVNSFPRWIIANVQNYSLVCSILTFIRSKIRTSFSKPIGYCVHASLCYTIYSPNAKFTVCAGLCRWAYRRNERLCTLTLEDISLKAIAPNQKATGDYKLTRYTAPKWRVKHFRPSCKTSGHNFTIIFQ